MHFHNRGWTTAAAHGGEQPYQRGADKFIGGLTFGLAMVMNGFA
jgi:hypothetical protein